MEPKCEQCGTTEDVEWQYDSYVKEIYGREEYRWYCNPCEHENYMDV